MTIDYGILIALLALLLQAWGQFGCVLLKKT